MNFDDKYSSARPYIACFVLLEKKGKIAMVLRRNTGWMDGFYGLPAGKVEYGETYLQAAVREAKEEAGVDIDQNQLVFTHIAHRHAQDETKFMDWVDVYFRANAWRGEPYNAETEKSERLDWLDLQDLPDNIVPAQLAAIEQIAKGNYYGEFGWE